MEAAGVGAGAHPDRNGYQWLGNGSFHTMISGMISAMKSTIDSAGRIVIPRDIRVEAGLLPDTPIEIRLRGGLVEIEPASRAVKVVKKGKLHVAVPEEPSEALTEETVNGVRRRVREKDGA